MCGPLSCLLLDRKDAKFQMLKYHGCRLLSYTIIAFLLAIVGVRVQENMTWSRFSNFVLWSILVFVILQFFYYFGSEHLRHFSMKMASQRSFPYALGLMSGILPCGLLVPAYIGSSSMPSMSLSLAAIGLFFVGTLPAMVTSQTFVQQLRKKLPLYLQPWINIMLSIVFLLVQFWMMT